MEIAQAYIAQREGFGMRLGDRESVQIKLGEVAQEIQIGRLLVMHAAWKLDQGDHARKEVSMAKVHVADTLHRAADVAIQLNGARGYSKDTILEWIYRYARQARLVDGASEVHNMVLARFMREEVPRPRPGTPTLVLQCAKMRVRGTAPIFSCGGAARCEIASRLTGLALLSRCHGLYLSTESKVPSACFVARAHCPRRPA